MKLRGGGSKFSTKKRITNLTDYEKENNNWLALVATIQVNKEKYIKSNLALKAFGVSLGHQYKKLIMN
jgi:hypothetical protein